MIQNLAIASDHAGYKLKNYIVNNLKREINIKDFGTNNEESCDFPDFAKELVILYSIMNPLEDY